jgi:hypothetical protein
MNRLVFTPCLVSALAFATNVAAANVPAWCSGIGQEPVRPTGTLEMNLANEDPRDAIPSIVARICRPSSDDTEHMDELEAARKKWSARLDLAEADWSDAAEYATLGHADTRGNEVALENRGEERDKALRRPFSVWDSMDQWYWLSTPAGASGDLTMDRNYVADALGSKLSEVGRFAYIRWCLETKNPVQWAMCEGDIERLDSKKLAAELRQNQDYGGWQKMRVRIAVHALKAALAEHAARVKKLIASDPGYAKIFELAAATRKDWEGRSKADAALLELASAMDDARIANSKRAFAGCEDKTWAAWKAAVTATVPAKSYEGKHDDRAGGKLFLDSATPPLVGNPTAYLASVALVTCMMVGQDDTAKRDLFIRDLGDALSDWPGFRGPRTAVETAILLGGISLDDRDARLEFPHMRRPFGGGNFGSSGGGQGVVAALKPSGGTVTVEFKKQMVKQLQCAQARQTGRITQIRPDGSLIYETVCVKQELVTVDKSDRPQTVSPRYLEGVKPGMYVSITEDVVVGAWAQPDAATPTMVFGVPLR